MKKLFPIISIIAIVLMFSAEALGKVTVRVRISGGGYSSYVVTGSPALICYYPGCSRTYTHYHGDGLIITNRRYGYDSRYPYYYRYQKPYYRHYNRRHYYNPYYRRYTPSHRYHRYSIPRYHRAPSLRRHYYHRRVPVYPHGGTGHYQYKLDKK
ncbi:hypothetical protein STSP2_00079 [Anaerohalosphaera lusitana]|uniref:Uncharacterized protein n=1 Tax=Anaerohalosphaera lusitana TaxID=1936003 RepID=A0A1U9NG83_9BACT|nr:hypothetical protein [Anaerohalosphaera lusitana]AQT66941.1 hypothetical protein STSP2_00079 [Anaerohalosphaera lusitana]